MVSVGNVTTMPSRSRFPSSTRASMAAEGPPAVISPRRSTAVGRCTPPSSGFREFGHPALSRARAAGDEDPV